MVKSQHKRFSQFIQGTRICNSSRGPLQSAPMVKVKICGNTNLDDAMAAVQAGVDAFIEGKPGGTGVTIDWDLAAQAQMLGPIILAGGLTPDNVLEAVRQVRPYAVDVTSGVEASPGKKDHAKVRAFITNAKSWTW